MTKFSHFEDTIHLLQKPVLSAQNQTPYALNASKTLSFVYILLIFSPQITVLQPPLQSTLTYVHQALEKGTLTIWDISNR